MQPIVLCPTQYEASRVRRVTLANGAILKVIGVGCGCEKTLREVARAYAGERSVILTGIAGALGSHATIGAAFTAERVIDERGDTHLPYLLTHTTRIALACSRDVVIGSAACAALTQRTGAAMVDMESGPFARVAQEVGWHWHVLRGISDNAAHELPEEVMRWLRLDGGTNYGNLAVDLLRKPRLWPQVYAMVRHANAAMRSVSTALHETLERIAT